MLDVSCAASWTATSPRPAHSAASKTRHWARALPRCRTSCTAADRPRSRHRAAQPGPGRTVGSEVCDAGMRCGRPGCGGSIEGGYCDECGMAPPRVPPPATSSTEALSGTGVPEIPLSCIESHVENADDDTTPSAVEVSSREARTRSRPRRLGTGLVEMPLVEVRDPESALMVDPSVPEGRRSCAACQAPVGRSVGGAPGRAEGFCRSCGAPFSFRPTRPRRPGRRAVRDRRLPRPRRARLDLPRPRSQRVADRWVVLKGLLDTRRPGRDGGGARGAPLPGRGRAPQHRQDPQLRRARRRRLHRHGVRAAARACASCSTSGGRPNGGAARPAAGQPRPSSTCSRSCPRSATCTTAACCSATSSPTT